ncbi:MAG: hypothetical protein WCS56_03830 [Bacilli bacterium]
MQNKINNIIKISTSINGAFFKYWLEFMSPFHHMTNKELFVASCILKHYYILSQKISDPDIVDSVLMSEDERKNIRSECNISPQHYQVILGNLKKKNVLINNKFNPKFIPNIKDNESCLLLKFELNEDNNK